MCQHLGMNRIGGVSGEELEVGACQHLDISFIHFKTPTGVLYLELTL